MFQALFGTVRSSVVSAVLLLVVVAAGCDSPAEALDPDELGAGIRATLTPDEYSGDKILVDAHTIGNEDCSVTGTFITDVTFEYDDPDDPDDLLKVEAHAEQLESCNNTNGGLVKVYLTVQGTTKHLVDFEADYTEGDVVKVPDGEYATLKAYPNTVENCTFSQWYTQYSGETISADSVVHVAPDSETGYMAEFDCGGGGGMFGPETK